VRQQAAHNEFDWELLRIHPSTPYKLIRAGRIPSFRVGSDWRFQQDLIERWITEGWKESKNVGQLKGVEPALGEIQLAP
jgi:excisionase family DNA binding protein